MNTNAKQQLKPKEIQYSPLRLVGILSMIAFCTILLIVGTFTRIKLINCLKPIEALMHPALFPTLQSAFAIKAYFYVPQIPVVLFAAALLGSACSMTSVFFILFWVSHLFLFLVSAAVLIMFCSRHSDIF